MCQTLILIAEWYSIVWIYCKLFIRSSINGHLDGSVENILKPMVLAHPSPSFSDTLPFLKRLCTLCLPQSQLSEKNVEDRGWEGAEGEVTDHLNMMVKVKVTQACPTRSSVHGIFQVRVLEWAAVPFSRGSSQPRDRTHVSHIVGRFFTIDLSFLFVNKCICLLDNCLFVK